MSKTETAETNGISRRKFLGTGIASAATVSLAPGVSFINLAHAQPKPAGQKVDDSKRWGMLIDTNKCAKGCDACVKGCNDEHNLNVGDEDLSRPEQQSQWIRKVDLRDKLTGHESSLPLMCVHCEHPPCVDVCPTGASFKREDGIVLVDKHICIGCRYCMMACPYKARSFIHEELTMQSENAPRGKGTVESCTLCVHRVDDPNNANPITACAEACNKEGHEAIIFGDIKDSNSEINKALKKYSTSAIREDLKLNPGVRYRGI
jgi:molybdopterin-containing oxidoreductase family iron-sulfur binding subunit